MDYKNQKSSSKNQKASKIDQEPQEESKKDQDTPITGIAVSILCILSILSILTLLLGTTDFILNDGRAKKVFSCCLSILIQRKERKRSFKKRKMSSTYCLP
uniref:Uncharacterized protein n=1 Tax=Cacopsylla melanoneura TaxID=428564 RepID=A0A8D8LQ43_9HEMI